MQVMYLLAHPPMQLHLIRDGLQKVGFAIRWQLGAAWYLEHFAVDAALRGQQYGSRVLREILAASPDQLVLEVEPPFDDMSQRRIRFYERHGLLLAPFTYHQPPYRRQEPPVLMRLMSRPAIVLEAEMALIARTISETVYEPYQ